LLLELLTTIKHRRSTQALAVRAVVDLSPEVREAALRALQDRPAEDYRDLLLAGLGPEPEPPPAAEPSGEKRKGRKRGE
jgi:hypothetical protein